MSTEEIIAKGWEVLKTLRNMDQHINLPVYDGEHLYYVPFTPQPNGSWMVGEVTEVPIEERRAARADLDGTTVELGDGYHASFQVLSLNPLNTPDVLAAVWRTGEQESSAVVVMTDASIARLAATQSGCRKILIDAYHKRR